MARREKVEMEEMVVAVQMLVWLVVWDARLLVVLAAVAVLADKVVMAV